MYKLNGYLKCAFVKSESPTTNLAVKKYNMVI